MMLSDSAQSVGGKLYILGGGWDVVGPDPQPSAIAMLFRVSWDLSNMQHHWRLELVTGNGEPATAPTPVGDQPVALEADLEVGRPAGVAPGSWLVVPLAINLGPLPLTAGETYEWRLTVGDESREEWRLPFRVRPRPPG